MTIQKYQIQKIQSACSGKFRDREERIDFMSNFFGLDINSTKDLTRTQADDLIFFLNTGKHPNNQSWGKFDNKNKQHRTILSLCHNLSWEQEDNPQFVDLSRLGGWLKSKRAPVQKPLQDMTHKECSKIIVALENMVKGRFK